MSSHTETSAEIQTTFLQEFTSDPQSTVAPVTIPKQARPREKKQLYSVGQVVGKFTIESPLLSKHKTWWYVVNCSCTNNTWRRGKIRQSALQQGVVSCGCIHGTTNKSFIPISIAGLSIAGLNNEATVDNGKTAKKVDAQNSPSQKYAIGTETTLGVIIDVRRSKSGRRGVAYLIQPPDGVAFWRRQTSVVIKQANKTSSKVSTNSGIRESILIDKDHLAFDLETIKLQVGDVVGTNKIILVESFGKVTMYTVIGPNGITNRLSRSKLLKPYTYRQSLNRRAVQEAVAKKNEATNTLVGALDAPETPFALLAPAGDHASLAAPTTDLTQPHWEEVAPPVVKKRSIFKRVFDAIFNEK